MDPPASQASANDHGGSGILKMPKRRRTSNVSAASINNAKKRSRLKTLDKHSSMVDFDVPPVKTVDIKGGEQDTLMITNLKSDLPPMAK